MSAQTKYWVFTYWGKKAEDGTQDPFSEAAPDLISEDYVYLVLGRETAPETGRKHLQGFVVFDKKKRLGGVCKILRSEICHWEPKHKRSTCLKSAEYCKKENNYVEYGEIPDEIGEAGGQATKQRYEKTYHLAKKGRFDDIDPDMLVRHLNNIRSIAAMHQEKPPVLDGQLQHEWWYGEPGTGKSRKAFEDYPGSYLKQTNKWWDGYTGQAVVVIDEWEPKHHYLSDLLKKWCDRYPFPAEVKGNTMCIRPEKVIVISNYKIEECFEDPTTVTALKRRFDVHHFLGNFVDIMYK